MGGRGKARRALLPGQEGCTLPRTHLHHEPTYHYILVWVVQNSKGFSAAIIVHSNFAYKTGGRELPVQVLGWSQEALSLYYYFLFCKGLAKITVRSEWHRTGIIESRDSILNDSLGLPFKVLSVSKLKLIVL